MAKPASILERLQQGRNEVLPSISISFQRLDAILELQEHIESYDHHLFEIWVGNLIIEEVLGYECTEALLI